MRLAFLPHTLSRGQAIAIAVCLVLPLHCLVQFLTYRYWHGADLLTLGLPAASAWLAYSFLISRATGRKLKKCLAGGLAAAFFSCWISMLVPINLYGT